MHAEALKAKNELEFLKLAHQFHFDGVDELMSNIAKTMFKSEAANHNKLSAINIPGDSDDDSNKEGEN